MGNERTESASFAAPTTTPENLSMMMLLSKTLYIHMMLCVNPYYATALAILRILPLDWMVVNDLTLTRAAPIQSNIILVNGSNLLFAGRRVEPLSDVVDIPPEQLVQMTLQQLAEGIYIYIIFSYFSNVANFSLLTTATQPIYHHHSIGTKLTVADVPAHVLFVHSSQVNPFVGMWRPIFPNLLALIRCIHLVWDTAAKTKLLNHEEAR